MNEVLVKLTHVFTFGVEVYISVADPTLMPFAQNSRENAAAALFSAPPQYPLIITDLPA
jgi:hypothetical protein